MTITCSVCGKPLSLSEINSIALTNETIVKICNIVRKRLEQQMCRA